MLFEISHLTARYGTLTAFEDVSLQIPEGSKVGIFGHNGSGKSTLLKSLIGAVADVSGQVWFNGQAIVPGATHANVNLGLGFVPQTKNVFPSLTVEKCLQIAGMQNGSAHLGDVHDIFPILKERRTQMAGSLSGGQQQLLAVGMAFMRKPRAILLDEPTAGLSPLAAQMVMTSLEAIHAKFGTSVIIVEQNVNLALAMVDRAIILKTGQLVVDSAAAELRATNRLWEWF
ncbi:MAG: hypothetical protein RIT26_1755 [Pseudomonadota bacterium]|jgi:branched-chain amino acid transport system ATP-binding protein